MASPANPAFPPAAALLLVPAVATAAVALIFWVAWRPPAAFYAYNLPIAAPFAGFILERACARGPVQGRGCALDLLVVALALLRVVAAPLPFVSGHALFTAYAAFTARGWPLRALAGAVLLQVAFMKLFVMGGAWSLLAGVVAAAVAALLRGRRA